MALPSIPARRLTAEEAIVLHRRHRRFWVNILRIACALISGGALTAIYYLLPFVFLLVDSTIDDPEAAAFELARSILTLFGIFGSVTEKLPGEFGVLAWARENAEICSFLIGGLAGWLFLRGPTRKLYDRALSPFDRRVLAAVRRPKAFDPLQTDSLTLNHRAMPWRPPLDGPRLEVWEALKAFSKGGDATFAWALLLGRPGAGKTRMALEFARSELALRHFFGGDPPSARLKRRLATWWRIQVMQRPPGDDDPWDVGWIRPQKFAPADAEDRQTVRLLLQALADWRPRRPTFIILDDPLVGDTEKVAGILADAANRSAFRHRVRLLVVNQSAPADMRLRRESETERWRSEVVPLFGDGMILPSRGSITATDVRRIRFGMLGPRNAELGTDEKVEAFLRITEGNPLLVELGLDWIRSEKSVETMSRHKLLAHRVERILEAMETAGFDQTLRLGAATATLASGGKGYAEGAEDDQGVPLAALIDAFGPGIAEPRKLASVFPADKIDLSRYMPPIRPELIGFAYVRAVMAATTEASARKIVDTAWAIAPLGALRAALTLDRSIRDRLSDYLATTPPDIPDVPLIEIFAAYAEVACRIPHRDWDDGVYGVGHGLETTALALSERLSAAELHQAIDLVLQIAEAPTADGIIRRPALNALMAGLLEMFLDAETEALLAKTAGDLKRWAKCAPYLDGKQIFEISNEEKKYIDLNSDYVNFDEFVEALKESVAADGDSRVIGCVARVCSNFLRLAPKEYAPWKTLATLLSEVLLEVDIDLFDEAKRLEEVYPGASWQRAVAWRHVAYANTTDPAVCRTLAEKVDEIARPFQEDRDFELERARAWRNVAYADWRDPAVCRTLAQKVDEIARPFQGDRDFELERARAWRFVAYANWTDPAVCRKLAEKVDDIARPFQGDRELERQRAQAWRVVAYANGADPVVCRTLAEKVDEIARPFQGDREFEHQRAKAWASVAYANSIAPTVCRTLAEKVDEIARPFQGDREFELERAEAWASVAYANATDPAVRRTLAEKVDEIAQPFQGDRDFELERAEAWRHVAYANTAAPAVCRTLAEKVDEIARLFQGDRAFELERAQAWRVVAYANRTDPAVCRAIAEKVDGIARLFQGDRDFELLVAEVWGYVVVDVSKS